MYSPYNYSVIRGETANMCETQLKFVVSQWQRAYQIILNWYCNKNTLGGSHTADPGRMLQMNYKFNVLIS